VRVELASGMQDSRNAFQRGSRMGMDFMSSDEPGDWRSTNRTSTTDDRGGGILNITFVLFFIFYLISIFLLQDSPGDEMVAPLIKIMTVKEIMVHGDQAGVMMMM